MNLIVRYMYYRTFDGNTVYDKYIVDENTSVVVSSTERSAVGLTWGRIYHLIDGAGLLLRTFTSPLV
jgi:hypothetical protein